MRAEVISPFRDKNHFNIQYNIGDVVDFDTERVEDLIGRKLCKKIEEQAQKPAPRNKVNKTKIADVLKEGIPTGDKAKSEKEAEEILAMARKNI